MNSDTATTHGQFYGRRNSKLSSIIGLTPADSEWQPVTSEIQEASKRPMVTTVLERTALLRIVENGSRYGVLVGDLELTSAYYCHVADFESAREIAIGLHLRMISLQENEISHLRDSVPVGRIGS